MEEAEEKMSHKIHIAKDEKLYLDEVELRNVISYTLKHSAGEPAELMIRMNVIVS